MKKDKKIVVMYIVVLSIIIGAGIIGFCINNFGKEDYVVSTEKVAAAMVETKVEAEVIVGKITDLVVYKEDRGEPPKGWSIVSDGKSYTYTNNDGYTSTYTKLSYAKAVKWA